MFIYVINLDRSAERMAEFRQNNAHLPDIQRFGAIDGQSVDRNELVEAGTLAPELPYTNGALGCALSHLFFWEAAVAEGSAITVCEDDAIFHSSFLSSAAELIASLPPDWDLVMWGWNFDSILYFDLLPGVSPCVAQFDQDRMRTAIGTFKESRITPRPFRLIRAFGTVCYTVSEGGARKLLAGSLPIRPSTVSFPLLNPEFPNNGIDIVMNGLYERINAYVSLPPLVVTENNHALSTVRLQR